MPDRAYLGGGGAAASVIPQEPTAFQSAKNMVQSSYERASALRERMEDLRLRTLGNEPQPAAQVGRETADLKRVGNGAADSLRLDLVDLGQVLDICHSIMSKLERLA